MKNSKIKNPRRELEKLFHKYQQEYESHKNNLVGVIHMLDGLNYHYKRHLAYERKALRLNLLKKIKEPILKGKELPQGGYKAPFVDPDHISHELVAYINRVGQLVDLFKSKWFQKDGALLEQTVAAQVSKLLALMPLRNKHTAHRQEDDPRTKDDGNVLPYNRDRLASLYMGKVSDNPVFYYQFHSKQRDELLLKTNIPPVKGIEVFFELEPNGNTIKNSWIQFSLTEQHSLIIDEAIHLIEFFLQQSPKKTP